jgi:hypothetical protein
LKVPGRLDGSRARPGALPRLDGLVISVAPSNISSRIRLRINGEVRSKVNAPILGKSY